MAEPRERQPWERQKFETRKAFDAFCIYRDLGGTRTLAVTAKTLGKSETWIEGWSARWGWVERSHAYDDHQEAIRQAAADQVTVNAAIAEAEENERQKRLTVAAARGVKSAALATLKQFLESAETLKELPASKMVFALNVIALAVKNAQAVENLDAGKPTEITQGAGDTAQVLELARKVLEMLEREHVRSDA